MGNLYTPVWSDAINSLITGYEDNLVVMGSLGETGTVEKIFGSNASDVTAKAQCPVIVIPPKTTDFSAKENIVLGSDYDQISDRKYENFASSLRKFIPPLELKDCARTKRRCDQSSFQKPPWE